MLTVALGGETLTTTAEHPFYTLMRGWVAAGALRAGDQVQREDGRSGTVGATRVVRQAQAMYNLTVDQAHTFFVGDGGWLVHNTCPGWPWKTIRESETAWKSADRLTSNFRKTYDEILTKLAQGDMRGLHDHALTGSRSGQRAVDIPGMGRGRGGGRIIYKEAKDGTIEIIDIITGHRY